MATDLNFNKFTYEDYVLIPNDGNRHEIIEGDHYMNPAPNAYHQSVSGRLQYQLYSRIELNKLGYVFNAPFDVQLDEFNIVQPDLVVVLNDRKSILSKQKATRRDMFEEISMHKDDDTQGSIRPQKVLWDCREVMGPHDILLSDVGAHKMWIARHYQCHEPNTCLIPNGFCSMGFALPGAIAASLVYPDRRILSISGDAGYLMNVQEMETAKHLKLNIRNLSNN